MTSGGISQPTNPGSTSRGFAWKQVTILSIDGNTAVVRDTLTKTFNMSMTKLPYKGIPPAVGETWMVTRVFGTWTFGLCLSSPTSVKETDIENLTEDLAAITADLTTLTTSLSFLGTKVGIRNFPPFVWANGTSNINVVGGAPLGGTNGSNSYTKIGTVVIPDPGFPYYLNVSAEIDWNSYGSWSVAGPLGNLKICLDSMTGLVLGQASTPAPDPGNRYDAWTTIPAHIAVAGTPPYSGTHTLYLQFISTVNVLAPFVAVASGGTFLQGEIVPA